MPAGHCGAMRCGTVRGALGVSVTYTDWDLPVFSATGGRGVFNFAKVSWASRSLPLPPTSGQQESGS